VRIASTYTPPVAAHRATGAASTPVAGFSVPTAAPRRAAGAQAPLPVAMPLVMPAEDALERRRQGARRGRAMLAGLDRLQLALLAGQGLGAALQALEAESAAFDAGDDAELAEVLDAIGLRVDVEIAKAQRRGSGQK